MSRETLGRLMDTAKAELHQVVRTGSETERLANRRYPEIVAAMQAEPLLYCIRRYADAELDWTTPGHRGIGRLSEDVPRLGGYFRRRIQELGPPDLDLLHAGVVAILVRGYLAGALFSEPFVPKVKPWDGLALFEAWVPRIYSVTVTPSVGQLLGALLDPAFDEFKSMLAKFSMKGGGFMSKDKSDAIIGFYGIGGYVLNDTLKGNT